MILIPIILYNSSLVIFCVKPTLTFSHKNKLFGLVFYTTKGVFKD